MIHLKDIKYWAVEKAVENTPDPPSKFEGNECVAGFISVEEDDLPQLAKEAANEIAQHAMRFKLSCVVIYPFAHLSSSLAEPERAISVLKAVEEELKNMGFSVNRAPFGWYKGFSITCPGHPMCELSRTITSPKGPFFIHNNEVISLQEAISKGLIEKEIIRGNPWDNESIGTQQKIGITSDGIDFNGQFVIDTFLKWLIDKFNLINVNTVPSNLNNSYGIDGLASFIRSCLDKGRYIKDESIILAGSIPGSNILIVPKKLELDPFKSILNEIMDGFKNDVIMLVSSSKELFNIPYDIDYELSVFLYKTRNNGMVTLGASGKVRDKEITCLGPMRNIISSYIDFGLKQADKGITPYLPFWLMPYQVAVIPVKEMHEKYAKEILYELVQKGIRAYLDPANKSLGTRIRVAGKSWVPIIVVVGDKEVESNTVNIRRRWQQGSQEVLPLQSFYDEIQSLVSLSPINKPLNPPVS
ncbi:MAG: hypothetical protein C0171_01590 [Caldisphaera sp.]|jgi:threonyl-tRNA synthetase|nr:MAG: hypothetical protein C0201_04170 [Caldisphaera sp.]PMP92099.1 MAG: hypothetical protein C0171_01590 [Caldisphaera sp.]